MAGSLNKVLIVGNLGADPEMRDLPSGERVANLRVATSESWTDKTSGEKRERTEWHNVSIFEQNAVQYAERYLKKGSKVYVEGRVETRKWVAQSGEDRYSTEIIVNQVSGKLIGLSNIHSQTEDRHSEFTQPSQATDIDDVIPF